MEELLKNEVYSIELIPGRNDCRILKDFASFFYQNNFVVTFGTEHNTPQLDPLKISCRGGVPLDEELKKINYEGAAVIAAHQYLQAQAGEGYLSGTKAKTGERNDFAQLGKAVMAFFFSLQQQSVKWQLSEKIIKTMEQEIKDLIEVSRYYGSQKAYVIAGGGNTSYKNEKQLWIKASGINLSTLMKTVFVCSTVKSLLRYRKWNFHPTLLNGKKR
jgi:hypothetical protein